jgi:hypothetical protein
MRSLSLTFFLVLILLAAPACKRRHRGGGQAQLLASTIYAGDPNVASHFAQGFYGIEDNAWRWTAKDFAVDLSPPLHSDQKGAQLVVKLAVPDGVIQKLSSVQLSGSVADLHQVRRVQLPARRAAREFAGRRRPSQVFPRPCAASRRHRFARAGNHRQRNRLGREVNR